MRTSSEAGCYGFRVSGLAGAADLLVDAPPTWPRLEVRHASPAGSTRPALESIGPDAAQVLLERGWIELDRRAASVTFRLAAPPPPTDLVHPYLAPAAAVAARWAGRDGFHAGAVLAGDGAWAVLAEKGGGKSSLLAWLAMHGHPVLTDDLLVTDGGTALAGPRCVDLRGDAAERLGTGEALGVVGQRERWRMALGPDRAEVPLRGFVTLAWGDAPALEPLRGAERLLAILPARTLRIAPDEPEAMLALSSLPVLRFSRPRDWDALPAAAALLMDRLAA